MSSRKYLSGAEKRKLKQQKENEAKNHPTIFKFLKPENDAKSNVTTHSSFNSDTMIENLETEIQVNNLDINSLNNYETELKLVANNSVSTNNVLMSSSNKVEISKDPGLWPETIDRFFREECIKLGSVFFQNRNKEYPASKRLFNSQNRFLSDNLFDRKMWCCHFESVRALFINYDNILNCLENINNDTEEKFDVRREAKSIMKKFIKFETAFMCVLWQTILERINKVSEKLQKPGLDLLSGCDLIRSLRQFIFHERNNYEKYDNLTQTVSTKIIDVGKRKQRRCENQTILCGKKKFQVDTFFVIIDKLISELDRRLNSYNLFLSQFKFLVNFKTDNDPDIDSLNNCIQFYHNNLDDNLKTEISHFYHYIKTVSSDIDNCEFTMSIVGIFNITSRVVSSRRSRQGSQCSDDLLLRLLITCHTNKLYDKNIFKMSNNLKRKRLSGSQYKRISKAKKEREEQLNKKTEKLDNYFKLKSVEQFSAVPLQCIENETSLSLSIENDTNKACDDAINNNVIDDELQLVNQASCSSKMSNVEEYTTDLEMQGVSSPAIDPAEWSINSLLVEHFILNQPRQDIRLSFRGNNSEFGSVHNGNYMGCLELIAQFNPFLCEHIAKYGNKERGNVSYLSSLICDEFIQLMNNSVADKIVSEINESKYFSIIVDSTPDISKTDQLTVVIRYITPTGESKERILAFLSSVGHKGEQMEYASVANSPGMLSMRRMLRNKNVINQNTKIILQSILYYEF
ncbi:hypothetical protein QTP88_004744 [Uroleucon formosanum]